jgi:hypothetical protein
MKWTSLLLFCGCQCFAQNVFAQQSGLYKGNLSLLQPGSKQAVQVPMELQLSPLKGDSSYAFSLRYQGQQARNYQLLSVDSARGQYLMDENNGIKLPMRRFGHQFVCDFEVQGNRLVISYAFAQDACLFTVTTSQAASRGQTGSTGEAPAVTTWQVVGRQEALLQRQ